MAKTHTCIPCASFGERAVVCYGSLLARLTGRILLHIIRLLADEDIKIKMWADGNWCKRGQLWLVSFGILEQHNKIFLWILYLWCLVIFLRSPHLFAWLLYIFVYNSLPGSVKGEKKFWNYVKLLQKFVYIPIVFSRGIL